MVFNVCIQEHFHFTLNFLQEKCLLAKMFARGHLLLSKTNNILWAFNCWKSCFISLFVCTTIANIFSLSSQFSQSMLELGIQTQQNCKWMKLPLISSLKCNHAKMAALIWIKAFELFVIVQNIIMIVLVGWKSLCCFTLSSIFSLWETKMHMWIWMPFPWCGGRKLCQVGCLLKLTLETKFYYNL